MAQLLPHAPPDWEDCHPSEEANIANVDKCADAVSSVGIMWPFSRLGLPSVQERL